jgi:DNA repair protein RecO (recombination protein O)
MHINAPAIICAVRPHGEHDVIARALTADHGLLAGYVRGGRSRTNRPILIPANTVAGEWRARSEGQLARFSAELIHSRAPLLSEPLATAALDWATALTAATLPEAHPYPRLHSALGGLLTAVEAAPAARGWAASLVRYELLILQELGFGLDLSSCAATGAVDDLIWVSQKSARAVSAAAGVGYEGKLMRLPPFLLDGLRAAGWEDVNAGLRLTGHFLAHSLLDARRADTLAARERLVDRLTRAGEGL